MVKIQEMKSHSVLEGALSKKKKASPPETQSGIEQETESALRAIDDLPHPEPTSAETEEFIAEASKRLDEILPTEKTGN